MLDSEFLEAGEANGSAAAPDSVEVPLRPRDLGAAERALWLSLQARDPALDRPFFSPHYCEVFDRHVDGIRVVPLRRAGSVVGFFPARLEKGGIARPVGGRLDDFQGPVLPSSIPFEPRCVLRECGWSRWQFDHRLERNESDRAGAIDLAPSPFTDLSEGMESFLAERRAAGAGWVKQIPRKRRKLGREVGEVRFEYRSRDPRVFEQLLRWKAEHRRKTNTVDPLDDPGLLRAVREIFETDTPEFAGILSALYAGPHLIGAHFGMRTRTTLHVWFPAYAEEFETYSPGMQMFVELLSAAAGAGITRVDFGRGPARYKESLMTGAVTVLEGVTDVRPLGRFVSGTVASSRVWVRHSPLAEFVRGPKRRIRRFVHQIWSRSSVRKEEGR